MICQSEHSPPPATPKNTRIALNESLATNCSVNESRCSTCELAVKKKRPSYLRRTMKDDASGIASQCCSHCGQYRVTDIWAADRSTGRQGFTSIVCRLADEGGDK